MGKDMEEKARKQVDRLDALVQFLGLIFGKDDYMSEVDAKECLYYVKYIRSCIEACLESQKIGQIPIMEFTVWARHDGKTEVTVNPNKDPQIIEGWQLSKLTKRIMDAINAWDFEDIGQKEGKVIDMTSIHGWTGDKGMAH